MMIPMATLNSWNKEFDGNMHPIIVLDKRGKASKGTLDMVREIIKIAKYYKTKGNRIRLKEFSRMPAEKKDISLSSKTVGDILTANALRSPLETVVAVYITMRNKLPLVRTAKNPAECMNNPVSDECRFEVKQMLQNQIKERMFPSEGQKNG